MPASAIMPCPYHADAPRVCDVCGARCTGSPSGKQCNLTHDPAKHDGTQRGPVVLEPPRWHDEEDGRYGA